MTFVRRNRGLIARLNLPGCFRQVGLVHDVVAIEDASGRMARNGHGYFFRHASPGPNRTPPKIVRIEPDVLVVCLTVLPLRGNIGSKFRRNTYIIPVLPRVYNPGAILAREHIVLITLPRTSSSINDRAPKFLTLCQVRSNALVLTGLATFRVVDYYGQFCESHT